MAPRKVSKKYAFKTEIWLRKTGLFLYFAHGTQNQRDAPKLVQTRTNYENENARTNRPPDHHLHPPPDHRRTIAGPPSVHHLHPSAHWTTDAPPPDHRRTTTIGNQNDADAEDVDADECLVTCE
ncbi:hypothetical protein LXL04_013645 [Taraxacum kok-saghyz]